MFASPSKRKYSAEEKEQLLANLDCEVEDRIRQIEGWLLDAQDKLRIYGESQLAAMPRPMRNLTLAEFAKYNGSMREYLKATTRHHDTEGLDRTTLKRKWAASQEETNAAAGPSGARDAESSRGLKSARTAVATPKKKPSSVMTSTGQRPRFAVPKTPGTARQLQRIPSSTQASPGPYKALAGKPSLYSKPSSRPASPSKLPSPSKPGHPPRIVRPPSSSTFNPSLPPQPRWPRKDENMMSVNGSPLANPLQLGLDGYLKTVTGSDGDGPGDTDGSETEGPRYPNTLHTLKKKSSIIIRSTSSSSHLSHLGGHSRTNSQSSLAQSQASRTGHSRNPSRNETNGFVPNRNNHPPNGEGTSEPAPLLSLSAFVSVPTKDGHVLEFDPLRTSPEEIDALEGITEGAKQQAKEDLARMIQAAMDRWKIS